MGQKAVPYTDIAMRIQYEYSDVYETSHSYPYGHMHSYWIEYIAKTRLKPAYCEA